MEKCLMHLIDNLLFHKRSIIETINDQLKNISQFEHSGYRSYTNFLDNLISELIVDTLQPKKPVARLQNMIFAKTH